MGMNFARPAAIELHIEELVLHGFSPADRFSVGDAIEAELARLLRADGLPPMLARPGGTNHLDAGGIEIAVGARPQSIGTQLACSIHQRLAQPPRATLGTEQRRMR